MRRLVLVFQKTRKLFGPKKIAGLFSGTKFFRKVFLNGKHNSESVLYNTANCSCELPHNFLNLKVTLEHSVIVMMIFFF